MFSISAQVRSFLLDDQRIQWSGLENSFAAEAVIDMNYSRRFGAVDLDVKGELLLSQPFNANILSDPYRNRYRQNFIIESYSFRELYLSLQSGRFTLKMGKMKSPFGRNHVPAFCNARSDQPFIRAESIVNEDTGIGITVTPGIFAFDLAILNGSRDQDTNSSKTLVARVGIGTKGWTLGISGKYFGDQGSETQKMYSDHIGMDLMMRMGRITLSAELIRERYGLHRPLGENEITWPRSFYYRDIHYLFKTAIEGSGGYINLNWNTDAFVINLNYGEFRPQSIGEPLHDTPNRRLLASVMVRLFDGFSAFASTLFENDRPREPVFAGASPYMYIVGLQFIIKTDS